MSFARQTFKCPFVSAFPKFMHELLRSMFRLGSFLIWLWLMKDLKVVPLVDDRDIFVNFWWLKSPFSSIKAWLSAFDGLMVADSSFLWVSVFFILQMKMSLIHSASSDSLMLHVLAKYVRAPQKCSHDSRSFCFRFNNLYLSIVVLGGLLNAASSKVQKSKKVIAKILTLVFFCVKTLFPSLPKARNKIDRSFLSASVRLIPLNFLFSSLIRFSSADSYCFIAFLFLFSLLALSVSDSLPFACSKIGICVSGISGPCRLSKSRFSLAMIANWNWSFHWVQACGGSRVWLGQKGKFHARSNH